ncbi:MAG: hypothetical protein IJ435_04540 [Clostridia bacterium]|nr:hypothetical protein [Clostridia bacterium]
MFIAVLFILILFPEEAQMGAIDGLKAAFETVTVAILPFAVVSSALIYSGFAKKMGDFCAPLFKRLKLHPYGATALITGLLGGYPTGCKIACEMYGEGLIDKEECEKILSYTNNGGLIFALNVCGNAMFQDKRAGVIIFIASTVSALLAGLIFARGDYSVKTGENKKLPLMAALGKSIASGGSVVLNIVASFIVFYAVASALRLDNVPFLEGIFEMTKGVAYAGKIKNIPLAAFFFSLGSLGVFAQSAAICSEYDISLKKYVQGKLLQATGAFLVAYLIVNRPFFGKEIVLFSFLAVVGVIFSIKAIKKLYAKA